MRKRGREKEKERESKAEQSSREELNVSEQWVLLAWSLFCTVNRNITHKMTHFRVDRSYTTILTTEMITITIRERKIYAIMLYSIIITFIKINHIVMLLY